MAACVAGIVRWLERLFFLVSVLCLAAVYATWKHVAFQDLHARAMREELLSTTQPPRGRSDVETGNLDEGSLVGVLEIARLELSVAVLEGADSRALRLAVGHLPNTPLPWQDGNSAVAGHRDTFFRRLKQLRVGDRIELVTRHGTFEYRVSDLLVVEPHELWVLDAADRVSLTLITCYPFDYVGPAPRRFVVRAERVRGPDLAFDS